MFIPTPHQAYIIATDEARRARQRFMAELGDGSWWVLGSAIDEYGKAFRYVPDGASIVELVKKRHSETGEPPLVVDLLATPSALRSMAGRLGADGVGMAGISVSLSDMRSEEDRKDDEAFGIQHVVGDLATHAGRHAVRRALAGRRADFILERGEGGLRSFPMHPTFASLAFQALWHTLRPDGGRMILQLPEDCDMEDAGIQTADQLVGNLKAVGIEATGGQRYDIWGFPFLSKPVLSVTRHPGGDASEAFAKAVTS